MASSHGMQRGTELSGEARAGSPLHRRDGRSTGSDRAAAFHHSSSEVGRGGVRHRSSTAVRSRRGRGTKDGLLLDSLGLNALSDAATGGGDVWINERRFRVLRQIGEGGFAVFLIWEHQPASDATVSLRDTAHVSGGHCRLDGKIREGERASIFQCCAV